MKSVAKKRERPAKGKAVEKVKMALPVKAVIQGGTLEKLVLRGDLSGLTPQETMEYYLRFCEHLGLDPVTRPFDLLVLNGKKVLYAHKGCTDQLRMKYGVSVTDLRGEMLQDCYRVTALGRDHKGRTDAATGVVQIKGLIGDKFANAVMKAETKAKRRLTLSLCGLGMLDESEIESIPGAATANVELPGVPVYEMNQPKSEKTLADPKELVLADLRDVYRKMQSSGYFTTDEMKERAEMVNKGKEDLQSLLDLQVHFVDEMLARKRGEAV